VDYQISWPGAGGCGVALRTRKLVKRAKTLTVIAAGFLTFVLIITFLLAPRDPIRSAVPVTFLCYTNCDIRGFNDQYKWAWFRIENKSPFMLGCQQGPVDIQRAGSWFQTTNTLGRICDPIVQPQKSLTLPMMPPADAAKWRSSFLLTRVSIHSSLYWEVKFGFARFMDRLHRLGNWPPPRTSSKADTHVVTSETLNL
jgi:hypothetical protein